MFMDPPLLPNLGRQSMRTADRGEAQHAIAPAMTNAHGQFPEDLDCATASKFCELMLERTE
jgi:hypothetical protein